jgi:hypothetical protein
VKAAGNARKPDTHVTDESLLFHDVGLVFALPDFGSRTVNRLSSNHPALHAQTGECMVLPARMNMTIEHSTTPALRVVIS